MAIVIIEAALTILGMVLPAVSIQQEQAQPRVDPLQHWRKATVALGQREGIGAGSKFVVTGSGIIVTPDGKRGCLLTARHMLIDPDSGLKTKALWMRVASDFGESNEPKPLPLFDSRGKNLWVAASDGSDLAVIPLPNHSSFITPNYDAVSMSDFGETEDDIFQGATLLILGYPQVLREPDDTNPYSLSPIARQGIVAWVDPSGPLSKPFIADANLYPGNSGGPVFRIKTGFDRYGNFNIGGQPLKFIGIVSRGPVQNAPVISGEGRVTKPNLHSGVQEPEFARVIAVGGIGVIEPVSRARRLLDSYFKTH